MVYNNFLTISEDKGDCIELDISKFFLINYSKANIHFGPDSQILRDKVRDVRTSSKRLHTQGHKLNARDKRLA